MDPATHVHCGCSELQMLSYDDVTTIGGSHVTDDSSLGGHLGLRNVCIKTICN